LRRKAALTGGPAVSARESGERDSTGARGNGPATGSVQARAGKTGRVDLGSGKPSGMRGREGRATHERRVSGRWAAGCG
jgi:hypothetical protein